MALYNTTTKQEFEERVVSNKKLVLVDFWAEWCPPCRAMAPTLHELAEKLDDKLDVVKVDVEASAENQQLAATHGVQGIPNMQVYKDGKVVEQLVGMRSKEILQDELSQHFDA